MALLKNKKLANKFVITAYGKIQFSAEGIADVEDSVAEKLATLKDYELVGAENHDEVKKPEEAVDEQKEDEVVDETDSDEEEIIDEEYEEEVDLKAELEAMNVKQLEKYAKENDIDLNGATKKADIISAILGE